LGIVPHLQNLLKGGMSMTKAERRRKIKESNGERAKAHVPAETVVLKREKKLKKDKYMRRKVYSSQNS